MPKEITTGKKIFPESFSLQELEADEFVLIDDIDEGEGTEEYHATWGAANEKHQKRNISKVSG